MTLWRKWSCCPSTEHVHNDWPHLWCTWGLWAHFCRQQGGCSPSVILACCLASKSRNFPKIPPLEPLSKSSTFGATFKKVHHLLSHFHKVSIWCHFQKVPPLEPLSKRSTFLATSKKFHLWSHFEKLCFQWLGSLLWRQNSEVLWKFCVFPRNGCLNVLNLYFCFSCWSDLVYSR